jgi:hypothetical protein
MGLNEWLMADWSLLDFGEAKVAPDMKADKADNSKPDNSKGRKRVKGNDGHSSDAQ